MQAVRGEGAHHASSVGGGAAVRAAIIGKSYASPPLATHVLQFRFKHKYHYDLITCFGAHDAAAVPPHHVHHQKHVSVEHCKHEFANAIFAHH